VQLRLYATTSTLPLLRDLMSGYTRRSPGAAFETASGNLDSMLTRLLNGDTPYFLSTHLPESSELAPLMAWPIAQDGLAIITHPANPTPTLTPEQLRRVYQGQINNWSEVGGPALDLMVVTREPGSGAGAEFERLVMGARHFSPSAQIAPSSAAMVEIVADRPGSIGYVSMSYLDGRIRPLRIDNILPTPETVTEALYPLRSTIYLIGLTEPEGAYLDFLLWSQSPAGQAIIGEQYGWLSTR
jgi:phosphate transport system substrate-binding protein